MGGATGVCEGDTVPPHFWDPEVQGGTMKMIFLLINLCFCKIFSLIDRQRILNIRNFLTRGTLVQRVMARGMYVCPSVTLVDCA